MKKLKYLPIVMLFGMMLFLTSATVTETGTNNFEGRNKRAQFHRGMHRGMQHGIMFNNLNDEQKEQIKQLHVEQMKKSLPVINKINETKARLRTLTTGDNININDAEKVLAELEKLKTEQAKQKVRIRVEIRKVLNDEQRIMFDAHKGKMKTGKARRGGSKGFASGQPMKGRHCMQQGMMSKGHPMHRKMSQSGTQQGMQGKGHPMQGKMSHNGMQQGMQQGQRMKGKPAMKSYHGNKSGRPTGGMIGFTPEQEEQLKPLKLAQMKAMTQYRNKLGEYQARLKTITSVDDVKLKDVDKLLDEMGKVKLEMAKNQMSHKQDIRAMLTDEQKVMFDMHLSNGARSKRRF